jgi:hypothetical protein
LAYYRGYEFVRKLMFGFKKIKNEFLVFEESQKEKRERIRLYVG